jgi:hypothetical protein
MLAPEVRCANIAIESHFDASQRKRVSGKRLAGGPMSHVGKLVSVCIGQVLYNLRKPFGFLSDVGVAALEI